MEKNIEQTFLNELNQVGKINSLDFAEKENYNHQDLVGLINSLEEELFIKKSVLEAKKWVLTDEGEKYRQIGTPEFQLYKLIPKEGISQKDLKDKYQDLFQFGFQNGMKKQFFAIDKGSVKIKNENAIDEDNVLLNNVAQNKADSLSKEDTDKLKKRNLIAQKIIKYFEITKGEHFATERKKLPTDLTAEMIKTGNWAQQQFKPFNFNSLGKIVPTGNLHPLLKVREQFKNILIEMGFEEMPTNRFVESSFWNFDSLFQPQQHPARDAHDTFFLADPEQSQISIPEYWEKVKTMHEKGGSGSIGWRYNWSQNEAQKNILRTHTTAVSAQMLYQLAQQKEFKPKRYFSIDRVFRNESLDKTHLAEFHQVEGLIADRNLSLGHLIGVIKEFFHKIGITKLWFKPAYNPYTEPSMEIFGYHPILKKKIEIGNSGMFRPEMLKPMGLPDDVDVIAWGLSLERPTMIQYDIGNIRELFGHTVQVKDIKNNPICIFKQ